MQVIVHGGAGRVPDEPDERRSALDRAAEAGSRADTPLDAAEAAVRELESAPRFNAGVGSAVQSDGRIRTDAGVMTGDRAVGAVCSMPGVEHAVSAARVVMDETPHVLVSGGHAVALAGAYGVPTDRDLWTDRTRDRWRDTEPPAGDGAVSAESSVDSGRDVRAELEWIPDRFGTTDPDGRDGPADADGGSGATDGTRHGDSDGTRRGDGDGNRRGDSDGTGGDANGSRRSDADGTNRDGDADGTDHDTVGAVAREGDRLAAATSTGGRWYALAGRVGDVPQVGAGYYCTPEAGASATGAGEDIARTTLARRAVDHVERGLSADAAADQAIEEFAELTGSTAGIIVCDASGAVGSAFNSDAMQTATASR